MPPGGGFPPHYDPKTQWKAYKDQQKAAWRAQRDTWKAQRYAAKASYIGTYGPRVPSIVGPIILIGIGVVALLMATGHIVASEFWAWYGHWWPLLLIAAGVALLGEWAVDLRRETPVRRSGSFVGILVLLGILGMSAAGWNNWWGPFRAQWGDHNDDFFNAFGLPERDSDQPSLNAQIPANATIEIQNPRGDVSVTAGDTATIEVAAHEVAFANSDGDANKIFESEKPHLKVTGSTVLVGSDSNASGRVNLTVTVPKGAHVTVNSGKGDVTVAGLGAGVHIEARGDVHLSDLAGAVEVHFSNGKHDFSAHQLNGDLTIGGDCNDLTLSDIKGKVTQNGEIVGDVHMGNVNGPIHLHTTVTDLQVAELSGDLTLNSDDLRVTEAKGQVRVTTHSKDVDLSAIAGDTFVENRDGRISIEPTGVFGINAKNDKGDIEVTLPPNTSATVDGHSHNGEVFTEFALTTTGEENKTVKGTIGSGSSRIVLNAENGDVRIKKGGAAKASVSERPEKPEQPERPEKPEAAPHLKTPKALPAHPVSQ